MPKTGDVTWSKRETKDDLKKKAVSLGLMREWDYSLTKADIVALLEAASELEVDHVIAFREAVEPEEEPTAESPVVEPPYLAEPVVEPPTPVVPPTSSLQTRLLDYMAKVDRRVTIEELVSEFGPAARYEMRDLISDRRVTVFKQGGKISFKVN